MYFLDKDGLNYFWGKAKQYVDDNAGADNYSELPDKPKINNVELNGNKSLNDIGIQQTVISETEPTDESVQVWINPSGDVSPVPTFSYDSSTQTLTITG